MPKTKTTTRKKPTTTRKKPVKTTRAKATVKPVKKKGVKHHAKRLYHLTPKFVHGMVAGAFIGILVLVPMARAATADALAIDSVKDCDSYSIINCGAQTTNQLKKAFNESLYVSKTYNYFTISLKDMENIGKTAVQGRVYNNGDVKVNGKLVATDAITAARQAVTSQDKRIKNGSATFYTRHIKTSWSHQSGPAYVVFDANGRFDFAILASCGNPIAATRTPVAVGQPVPAPHTEPKPTPPKPPKPPAPKPPQTDTDVSVPPAVPIEAETASVTTLPETGIGAILIVFIAAVIGGVMFHKTHHHVQKRRHHKKASHSHHHAH